MYKRTVNKTIFYYIKTIVLRIYIVQYSQARLTRLYSHVTSAIPVLLMLTDLILLDTVFTIATLTR